MHWGMPMPIAGYTKGDEMIQVKSLFMVCYINLHLYRQIGPQLKKKLLLSSIFYRNWISICKSELVIDQITNLSGILWIPQCRTKRFNTGPQTSIEIEYIEVKKNVLKCCHTCHIDHQKVIMAMNLVALILQIKHLEVSMINSSSINPKTVAQYYHHITDNQCTKEELNLHNYDLVAEETKHKELLQIKEELQNDKASKAINSKYIFLDNMLNYLSKADSDPVIWVYIPEHLRGLDNMGKDNTHNAIKTKYYWPDM